MKNSSNNLQNLSLNLYNIKDANFDEDLYAMADLETRKFCENNKQQYNYKILNFYIKTLIGVNRNSYSKMVVAKSHFGDDENSHHLGYLYGYLNCGNYKSSQFMLTGVYVLPNFRNANVGRSLINGLEESLANTKITRIFSNLDKNSDGFLMRCGFMMEGYTANVVKYINSRKGYFGCSE
jgi:ribosomal protein S18 acetylase RimI-like enzyme